MLPQPSTPARFVLQGNGVGSGLHLNRDGIVRVCCRLQNPGISTREWHSLLKELPCTHPTPLQREKKDPSPKLEPLSSKSPPTCGPTLGLLVVAEQQNLCSSPNNSVYFIRC